MKKIRMMMLAAGLLAVCSGDAQDMKRYRESWGQVFDSSYNK